MGVFDLHLHSKYSADGFSSPKKIVLKARKVGLSGFAITDHNSAASFEEFKKIKKELNTKNSKSSQNPDFLIIFGEEVKIIENKSCQGEILCYFLSEKISPGPLEEILDSAKKQDALTSIAHPFDVWRNPFAKDLEKEFKKFDAIEAFNGRSYKKKYNERSADFAKQKKFPFTAGSDSHLLSEIRKTGFECEAACEEELRKAILKKKGTVVPSKTAFPPWQWVVSVAGRVWPK
ncbi:MAG: PHP domain-containing protein [Candidatus Micrarchaeota archaeon]